MDQEGTDLNKARETVAESETQNKEEIVAYFIIGIFIAVVVGVLFSIFFLRQKDAKLSSLSDQINQDVIKPLQSYAGTELRVDTVLAQLDALNVALDSRIKYSSIMNDLANLQFKKSRWTSEAMQKDDTIVISGSADSFEDVAKAVIALRSLKAATDTKLSSANVNSETNKIDFVVNLKINKSLYKDTTGKKTTVGVGASATPTPALGSTTTPLSTLPSTTAISNLTPVVSGSTTAIIGQ